MQRSRPTSKSSRSSSSEDRPKRKFASTEDRPRSTKPRTRGERNERPKREYGSRDERPRSTKPRTGGARDQRPKREYGSRDERPRSTKPRTGGARDERPKREYDSRDERPRNTKPRTGGARDQRPKREYGSRDERPNQGYSKQSNRPRSRFDKREEADAQTRPQTDTLRLNKYIAQSGLCARRQADEYIRQGKVQVNGQVVTELGTKVNPRTDKVLVNGKPLQTEALVYILLNKPKNHVTTVDDPEGRSTVMDLVQEATTARVFPVGRLDRNTTGLLLLTNDGDLAKRLTHPSHQVRKLYAVRLDKDMLPEHIEQLRKGITLDDGPIHADKIDYVEGGGANEVGIEVHSGRNRIVRRMFEHLGYGIKALDRVGFASLTKKGLPRGRWRLLTPKEVGFLKML